MKIFALLLLFIGTLKSLEAQSEIEPNNSCSTGNLVLTNQWIKARLGDTLRNSDFDYFQIDLTKPGQYLIELKSSITGIIPRLVISGFNQCENISTIFSTLNDPKYSNPVFYFLVSNSGKIIIEFSKDNFQSSNYDYEFKITQVDLDIYEPNNTIDQASDIKISDTINAFANGYLIKPKALFLFESIDEDWYKISIEEKGILFPRLISVPAYLKPEISIYNSNKEFIGKNCYSATGESLESFQQLLCKQGDYFIKVSFEDTSLSIINIPSPYQMIVDFISDSTECNQTLASATPLQLGVTMNAYIGGRCGSKHDIDIYKIQTNKRGNLILDIWDKSTEKSKYVYFLDKDSVEIFSGYYNSPFYIFFSNPFENAHLYFLCSPDIYYIVVEERANDDCQNPRLFEPYQIRADVFDEDTTECNNFDYEAAPLNCNIELKGFLFPAFDIDKFSLKIGGKDTINFQFDFSQPETLLELILKSKSTGTRYRTWDIYQSEKLNFVNPSSTIKEFILSVTQINPRLDSIPIPYKIFFQCGQNSTIVSDYLKENSYIADLGEHKYVLKIPDSEIVFNSISPTVYNVIGKKMILPIERISEGWVFNASELSSGVYVVQLNLNHRKFNYKFLR